MKFSKYSIFIVLVLAMSACVCAQAGTSTSGSDKYFTGCSMNVTLVNQNPYPAQPDSYVDVVFQVNWLQNYVCNGSTFKLVMSYPFSLDSGSSVRSLPDDIYIQDYKKDWMVPYHLRVDKDALDGATEIEVQYSPNIWEKETPMIQKFNITVEDARTNFDAVMQEISGSDVSIAIANSGKYTANSVVVRIPEQENFAVEGTDGQMVGNLESGDYSVVGFTITQKGGMLPSSNFSRPLNMNVTKIQGTKNLKFDVYYTDNIGERRVVNMELPYKTASNGNFSVTGMPGARANSQKSSSSSSTLLIVAIVVIVAVSVIYIVYRIHSKKKAKAGEKGETPDWMKKHLKK